MTKLNRNRNITIYLSNETAQDLDDKLAKRQHLMSANSF